MEIPRREARALFVDWHRTLSNSLFWGHWAAPDHPRRAAYDAIQRLWNCESGLRPLLDPWMRGQLTAEQFVAATARLLCDGCAAGHDELMSGL